VGRRFLSPPVVEIAIDGYIEHSKPSQFDPNETQGPRRSELRQVAAGSGMHGEIVERLTVMVGGMPEREASGHSHRPGQRLHREPGAALVGQFKELCRFSVNGKRSVNR